MAAENIPASRSRLLVLTVEPSPVCGRAETGCGGVTWTPSTFVVSVGAETGGTDVVVEASVVRVALGVFVFTTSVAIAALVGVLIGVFVGTGVVVSVSVAVRVTTGVWVVAGVSLGSGVSVRTTVGDTVTVDATVFVTEGMEVAVSVGVLQSSDSDWRLLISSPESSPQDVGVLQPSDPDCRLLTSSPESRPQGVGVLQLSSLPLMLNEDAFSLQLSLPAETLAGAKATTAIGTTTAPTIATVRAKVSLFNSWLLFLTSDNWPLQSKRGNLPDISRADDLSHVRPIGLFSQRGATCQALRLRTHTSVGSAGPPAHIRTDVML
jgi:hypothetical protein